MKSSLGPIATPLEWTALDGETAIYMLWPEELTYVRAVSAAVFEQSLGSPERARLLNELDILFELKRRLEARMLPDDERMARGFEMGG